MRLKALKLRNFRGFLDDITIPFEDLTAFIGKNDVGKSSILEALAIFFDTSIIKTDSNDLCVYAVDSQFRIGCIFTELVNEIVLDTTSKTELEEEYLLNKDGDLEIHRIFSCKDGKLKEEIVAIAKHPTNKGLDDLLLLKNDELKKRLTDLQIDRSDVDLRSNVSIRRAIWNSCSSIEFKEQEIPLNKADAKIIWDNVLRELPIFALFKSDRPSTDDDSEIQDPMKLAVKNALKEVEKELEGIKEQIKNKTLDVAKRTVEKLRDIDSSLAKELSPQFKTEPKWDSIFKLSLTGDDQIPINKRGSGVRRLILLSFFRAEAERKKAEEGKVAIIYGIEEPETSQHPENQRIIIGALKELSIEGGCQVVITSHVPGLVGLVPIASIRYITVNDNKTRNIESGTDSILEVVAKELGVLPDSGIKVIVCVEGPNDIRFLRTMSKLMRNEDPTLPNLEVDSRIVCIPLGGSTLKDWVNNHYLRSLKVPEIHIYDRGETNKYENESKKIHARGDGSSAFITLKYEMENYLHPKAVKSVTGVEIEVTDENDVPLLLAKAVHGASGSDKTWDETSEEKRKQKIGKAKQRLNSEIAEAMSIEMITERGGIREILGWLNEIKSKL